MVKEQIKQLIAESLEKLSIAEIPIEIDYPLLSKFGDYSINVALKLAKSQAKNPLEIAKDIVKNIPKTSLFSKIEVVKPGFINFTINKLELTKYLNKSSSTSKLGTNKILNGKKVVIEYTDPNPFKEFHIGHLYSNTVGESLSRLYEYSGADVVRVCYQGDVGLHVAKAVWGMLYYLKKDNITLEELNSWPDSDKRINFMGMSYAHGSKMYTESETIKNEINLLNKKIYQNDPEIHQIYMDGRHWSLSYFEEIYEMLGTKFDDYFFESEVGPLGLKYVKENVSNGIFKESNGAVIFEGEKFGLHTRVFINALGLPTYEAKDLGLAPTKYEKYKYDLSIIVTGNEINEYFKVVLKALELINPILSSKTKHISHGMVRLPEGKMSSRTGNVITGEWLINTATNKAYDIIQKSTQTDFIGTDVISNSNSHVRPGLQLGIAEKVAIGAIKYALLKNTIGKNVEFNFNDSISFDGNSGPYLLYTYVRCKSILNKANFDNKAIPINIEFNNEELEIIRLLPKFEEIVATATINNSPNTICTYLYDFASTFNLFYQKHSILNTSGETKTFRLKLTSSVAQILKNGLYLLGIETVENM